MTIQDYHSGSKTETERNMWPKAVGVIISAMAAFTVAIVGSGCIATPAPTSSTPAHVKLRSINDGDPIGKTVDSAHGTYDRVPQEKEIWLVASRGSLCYPMDGPAIKDASGTWRHGPLEFLRDGTYQLSTVLADEYASAQLRTAVGKLTGLPCLPDGAEFIETISVEVKSSQTSTTLVVTDTFTSDVPSKIEIKGKICDSGVKDTIFLKETDFNQLDLPKKSKVNIHLVDTGQS